MDLKELIERVEKELEQAKLMPRDNRDEILDLEFKLATLHAINGEQNG